MFLDEALPPGFYDFWRDTNGNEIDLLWEKQRKLVPIKTKSATTWSKDFPRAIRRFRKRIPDTEPGYVVYAGELAPSDEDYRAMHFGQVAAIFADGSGVTALS